MSERAIKNVVSSLTNVCSLYQSMIHELSVVMEMIANDPKTSDDMRDAILKCKDLCLARLEIVQGLIDEANQYAIDELGLTLIKGETLH